MRLLAVIFAVGCGGEAVTTGTSTTTSTTSTLTSTSGTTASTTVVSTATTTGTTGTTTATTGTTVTTTTTVATKDADGDGYLSIEHGGEDCDDGNPDVNPGAYDTPIHDRDCDGKIYADIYYADHKFGGESEYDRAGISVSSAGDVDGDGLDDLLIGADYNSDGGDYAGKSYLILGSSLGPSEDILLMNADYSFTSTSENELFGHVVAGAGDVDGDGLDDLLMGAPYNDYGASNGGAVYLYLSANLGKKGELTTDDADYLFYGEPADELAGSSIAGNVDLDGDGLSDIVVGAYNNGLAGYRYGKTYILYGMGLGATREVALADADLVLIGENPADYAGVPVANAGDVDGDGVDDLLVGAPLGDSGGVNSGQVYLVLAASVVGQSELNLSNADVIFVGEDGSVAGVGLSSAGDVDGDGLSDILIGAYHYGKPSSGAAYLIYGASLGASQEFDLANADHRLVGEFVDDYAGYFVSTAGDIDSDGLSDILVGAYGNDIGGVDAGTSYLFLGSTMGTAAAEQSLSTADYAISGERAGDYVGTALSAAGDVNGDGCGDIIVGSAYYDGMADGAGIAYLLLGGC